MRVSLRTPNITVHSLGSGRTLCESGAHARRRGGLLPALRAGRSDGSLLGVNRTDANAPARAGQRRETSAHRRRRLSAGAVVIAALIGAAYAAVSAAAGS